MEKITAPTTDQVKTRRDVEFINPSLMSFIHQVLRKWWLFLLVGFIAALAGFFYARSKPTYFESRMTFAINAGSNDGASTAMSFAAALGLGLSSGQSLFDGDNIVEILKSRRIISNVLLSVDTFNNKPYTLVEYFIETNGLREEYNKNPEMKSLHSPVGSTKDKLTYQQDSVLFALFSYLTKESIIAGRPDKKLSLYELRIKSLDEKFSKVFSDRLIQGAGDFYTEITSKKERETLEILEQEVAALRGNVGTSVRSRAATQDANVNPAFAQAQTPVIMQQFNSQAYGEAYKEMFKTLQMARYQYRKNIQLLQIIDPADYPMRKVRQGKLKTAIMFSFVACGILLFVIWIASLLRNDQRSRALI